MSRIRDMFERLREAKRVALIPFIMAGDPDLRITEELVPHLVEAGADLIEIGVPFSDPIADGPINQRSAQRALVHGVRLREILATTKHLRERTSIPIVLLSYFNPLLRYGIEEFCRDAAGVGVDGLVVPDLPPDEADVFLDAARAFDLDTIFLVAPTSTDERIDLVCRFSTGFVYCVSLTGVTGPRQEVSPEVAGLLSRLRARTDLPLVVGFGISGPAQAREVAQYADGVIVGSALVEVIEQAGPGVLEASGRFLSEIKHALSTAPTQQGPSRSLPRRGEACLAPRNEGSE